MIAGLRNLSTLRARDLMTTSVVLVPKEMSLPTAAHLLVESAVSGAPVVDEQGRCIGVLSTTDFVHYTDNSTIGCRKDAGCNIVHPWEIVTPGTSDVERVADYMTEDPVIAPPDKTIQELARMMIDAHIHRVIIVDNDNRPVGIVSSSDILAAIANAEVY